MTERAGLRVGAVVFTVAFVALVAFAAFAAGEAVDYFFYATLVTFSHRGRERP